MNNKKEPKIVDVSKYDNITIGTKVYDMVVPTKGLMVPIVTTLNTWRDSLIAEVTAGIKKAHERDYTGVAAVALRSNCEMYWSGTNCQKSDERYMPYDLGSALNDVLALPFSLVHLKTSFLTGNNKDKHYEIAVNDIPKQDIPDQLKSIEGFRDVLQLFYQWFSKVYPDWKIYYKMQDYKITDPDFGVEVGTDYRVMTINKRRIPFYRNISVWNEFVPVPNAEEKW